MAQADAGPNPPANLPALPLQPSERLVSLDAYRGFIMLAMASGGLGIAQASKNLGGAWPGLVAQLGHVPWEGCAAWDLIQPAFMFMVGVAVPYSYARRRERGAPWGRMLRHAAARAAILAALGVFLASAWSKQTNFIFTNVLAQIGLGYVFVFLAWGRGARMQAAAVAAILVGTWCMFYFYPAPEAGPGFDRAACGLPEDWPLLSGLAAHWNKNANVAARFDLWFLNLFPGEKPFAPRPGDGGYATLNFLPSIATMILGLMAGELLRSARSRRRKLLLLAVAGAALMALGLAAGWTVCPIVKRIWTPSWVLYSGAWVVWMLAAFYAATDAAGLRRWALPLAVVGMNSIVMYMMAQLMKEWTWSMLGIHLGPLFAPLGLDPAFLPIVKSASVLLIFWLICVWLHRQRIFVRI
jgi:predicted acyltransferase